MSTGSIARHTDDEVHFFNAGDGTPLTLIRVLGSTEATKGPVMLVHGVAMRAESFRPPIARTLVDALLDDGWDVWMLNWRGSVDLDPLPWTLDDVALHDIPAAVRHIVAATGAESVKAIAHCGGSIATSVAAVSGLVPELTTIVANGISLHAVLPRFARVKLRTLRPLWQGSQPFVDINWGDGPERGIHLLTRNAVRVWHYECGNATCNMASFALGSGHPALLVHANVNEATHNWLRHEFGRVPLSFYSQMATSSRAGQYVTFDSTAALPSRPASLPPQTQARFSLITGEHNRAYLPESQRATFRYLEEHQPGRHSLHVLPRYGHLDMFIGARAHAEVYPLLLRELVG